jgi:hypothetical protein
MKKAIAFISVWMAFGVFNWNVAMADFCGELEWTEPSDHYGICLFLAATGPFGTVTSVFVTNLFEHGFYHKRVE